MAYTRLPTANFSLLAKNNIYTGNQGTFLFHYPIFYLDDDSCILFVENNSGYTLNAVVYDKSGKYTAYKYVGSPVNYVVNILPFDYGKFLISLNSGAQIIQQFSNAKLNNSVPIPFYSNISISTPCYGPPNKYFYDSQLKILGCAAYQPLGQDGGPVFDAEYLVTAAGLNLLSSGYTGIYYSPTNIDPYDKTNQNFTGHPYITIPLIQSNSVISNLMYNAQGVYYIARNTIGVNVGQSSGCDKTSLTGSYAYSKNATLNYFLNNAYANFTQMLDSNIQGLNGSYNDYGASNAPDPRIEVFDQNNNVLDIPVNCGGGGSYKGIVITKSNIFLFDAYGQNIYIAPYDFLNPFNDVSFSRNQLTNFHRPVSILGKYKA